MIFSLATLFTHVLDGEGVEISNRDLRLEFNGTGHLVSWSDLRAGVSHSLSHLYLQEAEKEDLNEENVCDGTNVYTFVPDRGTTVLTPKVMVRCPCQVRQI